MFLVGDGITAFYRPLTAFYHFLIEGVTAKALKILAGSIPLTDLTDFRAYPLLYIHVLFIFILLRIDFEKTVKTVKYIYNTA